MPRRSPFVLLLMAAACFSDAPPAGLSTSGTSPGSTTGGEVTGLDSSGATSTTTATSTTATTALTTSAATTDEATSGATVMGATSTGDQGATTSATDASTGGTGTTDLGPFAACEASATQFECFQCCHATLGDWEVFRGTVTGCVCPDLEHPCHVPCAESLCNGVTLEEVCFGCLPDGDACLAEALVVCSENAQCLPFAECVVGAACGDKP